MELLPTILLAVSLVLVSADLTRSGRCPHAQYAFSGPSCSTEGDDSSCPSDYKCCPSRNGMSCFSPCPEFTQPCTILCLFGFKAGPALCTFCECAENPCLSTVCPLGTLCNTKNYEPCAIPGQCGMDTECIDDPSIQVDPTPKPKNCPDYWPSMGSGLQECRGQDALCPGEEKCCQAPPSDYYILYFPPSFFRRRSYCVRPCEDISNCTLKCPYGFATDGNCRLCQCLSNPCDKMSCASDETCEFLPTTCVDWPGQPPCPLLPGCMNEEQKRSMGLH